MRGHEVIGLVKDVATFRFRPERTEDHDSFALSVAANKSKLVKARYIEEIHHNVDTFQGRKDSIKCALLLTSRSGIRYVSLREVLAGFHLDTGNNYEGSILRDKLRINGIFTAQSRLSDLKEDLPDDVLVEGPLDRMDPESKEKFKREINGQTIEIFPYPYGADKPGSRRPRILGDQAAVIDIFEVLKIKR